VRNASNPINTRTISSSIITENANKKRTRCIEEPYKSLKRALKEPLKSLKRALKEP
jgi:hypothetical protein